MAELRSFIFLDRLQPQTMCYLGSWVRGALPRAGYAAQIIEVAPGLDIEPLTDVALKHADVGAGILFVAFAGYARITVLGEEVRDPRRTIPRAMIASFAIIIVTYAVVGVIVLSAVGAGVVLSAAPLEAIAESAGSQGLAIAVRVAAVIAAGAVLLSLIAGMGRTLFAMGRGGDAPAPLARVSERTGVPSLAEISAAVLACLVVLVGGIGFALALSAALILTYYGVAHLAVLARVGRGDFPRTLGVTAALGLIGCVVVVAGLSIAAASPSLG